jgi:hypothetical protein
MRQMVAIVADTHHRAQALASVRLPALVLHGRSDPLVPFACGEDTARRIHGAELVGIEGMGHDLAPGVVERLVPPLLQFPGGCAPRRDAACAAMFTAPEESPLGKASAYPDHYDPALLFPIARADKRR